MKFKLLYIVLSIFLLQNISCHKPCNDCGDPLPFQFIKVKIVNQQGKNLLFGISALYNPDSIRILEQKNILNSSIIVTKHAVDSSLVLTFNNLPAKTYIYYNQQTSLDSMEIKWLAETEKCCGKTITFYKIDSVKFNNTSTKIINDAYIFIK